MPRTHENALQTLYKYRSLAPQSERPRAGREAAENIIRLNRIYWQSPLAFNDPFDCNPALIFGTNSASRVNFAKRAVANNYPSLNRVERAQRVKEFLRVPAPIRTADIRTAFRQWMEESAVTCFSQVRDSILMWAHYADSHRGVCFIFREVVDQSQSWWAYDVTYSDERPVIDYTQDPEAMVKRGILNKSVLWEYEKECRMLEYRRAPGYRSFPREALVGVIYGARISEDDRAFMDDLLSDRRSLEKYQATLDEHLFQVNIERI